MISGTSLLTAPPGQITRIYDSTGSELTPQQVSAATHGVVVITVSSTDATYPWPAYPIEEPKKKPRVPRQYVQASLRRLKPVQKTCKPPAAPVVRLSFVAVRARTMAGR